MIDTLKAKKTKYEAILKTVQETLNTSVRNVQRIEGAIGVLAETIKELEADQAKESTDVAA